MNHHDIIPKNNKKITDHRSQKEKRREAFEQENKFYFDVIQSRLFKEDFCKENIDNVIEASYKMSKCFLMILHTHTNPTDHTDFSLSSLRRDYNLCFKSKCSLMEDV